MRWWPHTIFGCIQTVSSNLYITWKMKSSNWGLPAKVLTFVIIRHQSSSYIMLMSSWRHGGVMMTSWWHHNLFFFSNLKLNHTKVWCNKMIRIIMQPRPLHYKYYNILALNFSRSGKVCFANPTSWLWLTFCKTFIGK